MIGELTLAAKDELPEIATLWYLSWVSTGLGSDKDLTGDALVKKLEEGIGSGWDLYTYREDGALLAMLAIDPAKSYLSQMFIKPEAQGRGIGRALLAFCREQMPDQIKLNTAELNTRAVEWYEREGFKRAHSYVHPLTGHTMIDYIWKRV